MSDRVLRTGDHGEAVRDLQQRLTAAGVPAPANAEFDAATEAAVRDFQARRRLRIDGICGPETWGALIESAFRPGDRLLYLRSPMLRGDDVADLQQRLNALGFHAGREDGIFGPETETALRRFQRDAGIATDAVCGPATLAALKRLGGLAAGSVAEVREREHFRRDLRPLDERRCFVVSDPGLEVLADAVGRGLREAGAEVALDVSGQDTGVLAAEANRYGADVCLSLGPGTDVGVRCAYFATEQFRSEAGYSIARRMSEALAQVAIEVGEPAGRTYKILRETRMAAVAVEFGSFATLAPHAPDIAAAIVRGIRRGVEEPLELPR